jgi:iron complex outermembrane receptor protein
MRRFILSGLLALSVCGVFAQHQSISDTILLEEVNSYAPFRKYQAGTKVETISTEQLEIAQAAGLDQLLMRFSPIYLKSNAGGLSTIRIRGTAPDHTSVNFGGININSLTLGQTNMSSVPIYLFDGVDLQYGSSSAVNGSGSIGGALYLGLKNNWTNGGRIKVTVAAGSFGEQLYGTKVYLGNGKFESVSRAYYFKRKNDFPFTNPDDNKRYTQRGAVIENMGVIQELNYRFSEKEWLKSALWMEHDWHQVQLVMGQVNTASPSTLDNKHIRFWSEYENRKQIINYKAGIGYVYDNQVSGGAKNQKIATNRLIAELEANKDFSQKAGYKLGLKYKYIKPDVYSYSSDVIDKEQHVDLYLMGFYSVWNKLKFTLNLRQQFVTNFEAPFTPAIGAEYRLFVYEFSVFKLNGNIARSYRVPTFNDRFWGTQGNPDLNPEDGINYEAGLQYLYCSDDFQTDVKLNGFYMDVNDWIEWRPGTIDWEAENRSRVISKGIEFQSNSDIFLNKTSFNFRINYSFNPTTVKEDLIATLVDQQLIYVPKHTGNVYLMGKHGKWSAFADASYTGERLADHSGSARFPDGTVLDDYVLINMGFGYKMNVLDEVFQLSFAVNNLLNKNYQNQLYYAMPGRNFRFTLSTDLNFNKN